MHLGLSRTFALRLTMIALAALMIFNFSFVRPVQAETAGQRSTRNIILAGIALTAGIILYNNYHHKQVAHNTVVGHTADGGTVYADGRIVYPNGTVVYTSNDGRQICRYDGYGVPCGHTVRAYRVARGYENEARLYNEEEDNQGHDHGNHYGQYKHENQGGDGGGD
jgi:hypothetical protein